MTEVAGEVADGLLAHAFTTERYLREVDPARPRAGPGHQRPGTRSAVQISFPGMVVTGVDEQAFAKAAAATRKQLAFYGSTPAYRPVLDLHGWGDLQKDLNTLSKRGAWDEMAGLIDDEMLQHLRRGRRTRHHRLPGPGPLRRPGRPLQPLRTVRARRRAVGRAAGRPAQLTRHRWPIGRDRRCRRRTSPAPAVTEEPDHVVGVGDQRRPGPRRRPPPGAR